MYHLSRRRFAAAAFAGLAIPAHARTLPVVGVQLYTVRSIIEKDPLEVLRAIEKAGYREVEATAANLGPIWQSLKRTSMKPVSVHLETPFFTHNQSKLPAALDDAKKRGFEYAVCPYIAPEDRGGVEVIQRLAETLNKAGEVCNRSGLRLCYHNHAFEFQPSGGGNLLDVLMRNTDPKLVGLELDIMWAQVGGPGPLKVLEQHGSRVALMHLKNVAPGVGPQYNEKVPKEAFKEVGAGVIDIAAVLRAAKQAGVKHYFVEQDQTPGNPVDSLRQSIDYLSKLDF
jgi:sugar phosphate isomerase/epimerase